MQTKLNAGLILAVAYFVAGEFGLLFSVNGGFASPLFPAAGIAIAFALTYGSSMSAWVFAGAFILNVTNIPPQESIQNGILIAFFIGIASALQTYAVLKLIRMVIGKTLLLASMKEVVQFAYVVLIGCLTSATIATLALSYLNHVQTENITFFWLTWWFGDVFGVILVAPVVLTIIGGPKDLWRARRRQSMLVVITGIAFISVVEIMISKWEQEKNYKDFISLSDHISEQVLTHFSLQEAFVDQLAALMGGGNRISSEDFDKFAKIGFERFIVTLQAVEWAPDIANENRKLFEHEFKNNYPGFQITERNAEGRLIAAKVRQNYVPVTFLLPIKGNEAAYGFDLASNATRNEAINFSKQTHSAVATPPINLVQEKANQSGLLLVHWVNNGANGSGLVLVVLRLGDFMDSVNASSKNLINVRLIDEEQKLTVYDAIGSNAKNILFDQIIHFGQRSYRIQASPTNEYLNSHRNWQTWSITLSGLAFISSLSMTLLLMSARTARVETLVSENEQRWQLAVSGSNDGIWDWNLKTNEAYFSERFKSMLGFNVDEIKPHIDAWVALVHPDDLKETQLEMRRHFDGLTRFYERELRIRCKNGEYKWILCRGQALIENNEPIRMVGSHTDISLRRAAEIGIRDQAEQLDAIFTLSPDGFLSFDNEHKVRYVSPSFTRLTGIEQNSIIGIDELMLSKLIADMCIPQAQFPGITSLRNIKNKSGELSADQLIQIELLAKRIVLEVGFRQAASENVSQILYFRDITHETEIDRMKSEFLSTAAHELRTPMSSIYGFSELLLANEFNTTERNEFLTIIYNQSELMISIINELLDLARIDARRGKDFILSNFNLAELIQESISEYKTPAGRSSPEIFNTQSDGLIVRADRNKLRQALNNIISNAYKYSPDGGDVRVGIIGMNQNEAAINGEVVSKVGIRIEDHGIGMTTDQLARVFERFYRADTSGKIPGTGLGMSIVKEIVELHGGSIQVESVYSRGTVVTIWLPVHSKGNDAEIQAISAELQIENWESK